MARTNGDSPTKQRYKHSPIFSVPLATDVQLDYNSHIKLVPSNNANREPCYDTTTENSDTGTKAVYRAIRIKPNVGADIMLGRGTRVWEVRRLVGGKLISPLYALKDAWARKDCVAEHVILEKIRRNQLAYTKYFVTPVDYGSAPFHPTEPSIPDNTHKALHQKELEPTKKPLPTHTRSSTTIASHTTNPGGPGSLRNHVGDSHGMLDSSREEHRALRYRSKHPRRHYHSVLMDIGTPVHNLHKFTDIFAAIQGGWEGLHAIHLCRCFHRDVSSGNILLVPAQGTLGECGVIMDLEHGKAIDDTSVARDVRTGTMLFMATEVALMDHHRFRPILSPRPMHKSREALESIMDLLMEQSSDSPQEPVQVPLFCHNPLHDMESIWWLCMWMMLYLAQHSKDQHDRLENYRQVFGSAHTKMSFFCYSRSYRSYTSHLSEYQAWVRLMELWSEALNTLYTASYEEHDTSVIPPETIRISDKDIETSYKLRKEILTKLQQASTSPQPSD